MKKVDIGTLKYPGYQLEVGTQNIDHGRLSWSSPTLPARCQLPAASLQAQRRLRWAPLRRPTPGTTAPTVQDSLPGGRRSSCSGPIASDGPTSSSSNLPHPSPDVRSDPFTTVYLHRHRSLGRHSIISIISYRVSLDVGGGEKMREDRN